MFKIGKKIGLDYKFSTGGFDIKWNKNGKSWEIYSHVLAHLRERSRYYKANNYEDYKDCFLFQIEFDPNMQKADITRYPMEEVLKDLT